ncbi:MAG: DUF1178 family protein [Rubrivivax sp.]
MKVLDLRCQNGHVFEGWFGSDDDFMTQNGRGLIECPLCADRVVVRTPTAPRLNLSGARAPGAPRSERPLARPALSSAPAVAGDGADQPPRPATAPTQAAPASVADLQTAWVTAVRGLMARTEDVGTRFAEEARRIHYGEAPERGIRGKASAADRAALQEEGIETVSIPVPRAFEGPLQ